MEVKPFEGVHFYSAQELAAVLSGFAHEWSKKSGKFIFDRPDYAKNLAVISAANAKAFQAAHGAAKTAHTAEQILAALPVKPVPHWLGLVREFDRGLAFNLLGYDPGPITDKDIEVMGIEVYRATLFLFNVTYDEITGPREVP